MPLTCGLCDDPRLADIEAALGGGASQAVVAREFGLSRHAVGRHLRGRHGPDAAVVAVASPQALRSKGLERRAHALLALADAEVRAAERSGSVMARLRALRGYRRSLAQSIAHNKAAADVVQATQVQRAEVERSWLRAVDAFDALGARWPARLSALEGLREALAALYRVNPPEGGGWIQFVMSVGGRIVTEGKPFYTRNPDVLAMAGRTIQLRLPGDEEAGESLRRDDE